jgi:2-C-methyl-D-erythritol 2,4-cyclodiphosphate synthase|tara:strand:+ start:84 stop:200 length:117 start_codon:yes stop_codon:yes gene_type:complete
MVERGYRISNVDVTLICEKPRVNVEHNGRKAAAFMMEN